VASGKKRIDYPEDSINYSLESESVPPRVGREGRRAGGGDSGYGAGEGVGRWATRSELEEISDAAAMRLEGVARRGIGCVCVCVCVFVCCVRATLTHSLTHSLPHSLSLSLSLALSLSLSLSHFAYTHVCLHMQGFLEEVQRINVLPPAYQNVCTPADDEEVGKLRAKIDELVSKKVPRPGLNPTHSAKLNPTIRTYGLGFCA
jgi:hypothetical protein